jgi:redox-sensitive bicupin YhaK (pirin superfamily)
MNVATGIVIGGKVVVEGDVLVEGAKVTVLTQDEETFELSPEEERVLLAAITEADRGDFVSSDDLLADLRQPG